MAIIGRPEKRNREEQESNNEKVWRQHRRSKCQQWKEQQESKRNTGEDQKETKPKRNSKIGRMK